MYCPYCGAELPAGADTCPNCGQAVEVPVKQAGASGEHPAVPPKKRPPIASPTTPPGEKQAREAPHEIASTGLRFVALIIDLVVIAILQGLVNLIAFQSWTGYPVPMPDFSDPLNFDWTAVDWGAISRASAINSLVGFLVTYLYFLGTAAGLGRTAGKAALRLRTVNEETYESLRVGEAAVFALGKANFLLFLLDAGIGFLTRPNDGQNRIRLLQRAAHALVVRER